MTKLAPHEKRMRDYSQRQVRCMQYTKCSFVTQTGGDRKALVKKYDELNQQVDRLRNELATYSEYDPVELDKKIEDTRRLQEAAERFTEHIYCMESWLKERVPDRESQVCILKDYYGEEWDDEDGGLREL